MQKLYLLNVDSHEESTDEEEEVTIEEVENEPNNTKDEVYKISYNALLGISSPQIMKCWDYFKNKSLIILIDFGSTHNSIDPRVTKQANYFIYPQNNFEG